MLADRSKSLRMGCLLLGLLFCLLGGFGIVRYQKMVNCFEVRPPLKSFVLTIDRSQQEVLIEQARKFADKYQFKFDIAYFSQNSENFRIGMIRKDVELVILNTIVDLDHYDVLFYNYDCDQPTVVSDIEGLVADLKSLISEIPSASITEEK